MSDYPAFPKIARWNRGVIVTEKLDGTNAQVYIDPLYSTVRAGSRTRWITPEDDNAGFARWVKEHEDELRQLGPGQHFGEWWGQGIQRGYGLEEKRFSLFNTHRWSDPLVRPACCHVVPTLYVGPMARLDVEDELRELVEEGSVASPGFYRPEGVVIYHAASGQLFKATIEKDEQPKGRAA